MARIAVVLGLALVALAGPARAEPPTPVAPEPTAKHADAANAKEEPADALNGFRIDPKNPNRKYIKAGGPARDAIHSVDAPEFAPASEATWAPPPVAVIGVEIGGDARAYPVHLMEYHQIVNDTIDGVPVVVTYDPLTGIPAAWKRTVGGRVLEFGVSGLLYREQFLLYDRQTDSLWAQYEGVAVAGKLTGERLERIQVRQEPMGMWLKRYPAATVLKRPELHRIDYRYSPYEAYWTSKSVPVPVRARDDRYHPKEVVLGVEVNGKYRAYLGSILTAEGGRIVDTFQGVKLRILYDPNLSLFIWDVDGDARVTDAYWFAWKSLHPDTDIWHDEQPKKPAKP